MKKIFSAIALLAIVACGQQKPAPPVSPYLAENVSVQVTVQRFVTFKKVGNCYKKVVTYVFLKSEDYDNGSVFVCADSGCANQAELVMSSPPPSYQGNTIGEAATKFQQAELKEDTP